ncbi:spermatid-specific linker histone H1-like protein [Artibeus jamaicensis]|uniref:spermatid-specific linker histone H1-like protein n=1 Tax=Artibeus jamaicensis TaxID=9417 RepID=UPI00235A54D1|nr:spermatid-specific linker histone H1-like protein [Artibeus jamaicensis]
MLEVLAPSPLPPPEEEMQKDTLVPPSSAPSASNSALGGAGQQASVSGVPSKSQTGCRACPKACRKPSICTVILEVMADKAGRSRVSLATLKKALIARGYNMTRNAWRFKKVLKRLVDKGILKRVTSKGTSGSFRMNKKQASKLKLKAKRRGQKKQCRSRQRRSRQRRLLLNSKRGRRRLIKRARRVAKCHRN